MKFRGPTEEYFEILYIDSANNNILTEFDDEALSLIWILDDDNEFVIDGRTFQFEKDNIISLTAMNQIEKATIKEAKVVRFNRPFYCILDHDSEVGCRGALFFGASNVPVIYPNDSDAFRLANLWNIMEDEMQARDNLQLEMLQMLLKRLLILCTRIYNSQNNFDQLQLGQGDLFREFNFLVEQHFKTKHAVADYAELLNKSPKTLSNLFGKLKAKSPLQIIQNRIMLEVRRLLRYTDRPVSEIGYSVGFNDIQSFSRFFKKHEGISPSEYRLN